MLSSGRSVRLMSPPHALSCSCGHAPGVQRGLAHEKAGAGPTRPTRPQRRKYEHASTQHAVAASRNGSRLGLFACSRGAGAARRAGGRGGGTGSYPLPTSHQQRAALQQRARRPPAARHARHNI
jgi:hypothetical protein